MRALTPLGLAGLAFPFVCVAVPADDEEALSALYGDAELVSIATGTVKPVFQAPSVASVITAEDIADMGAHNLDEVLESVPGMHVGRSALNRLDSVYGIRGLATDFNPQTLLLVNGIRFGNLHSSGRAPTFRLPVSDIARIEIIRGPGSALYGADAFAGVINVITKSAAELKGLHLHAGAGSFQSRDYGLQWGTDLGQDWQLGLSVEKQRSDGDRDRVIDFDTQSALDSIFGTHASLAPGALSTRYDIVDTHLSLNNARWTVHYWNWQQDDGGEGAGASQAVDPVGYQDEDQHLFDVAYDNRDIARDWDLGLRYSYQHTRNQAHFQLLPPGTLIPIGADGNINLAQPVGLVLFSDGLLGNPGSIDDAHYGELFAEYTGWANHRWRFSAGGRHEAADAMETKNYGPGVIDGTETVVNGRLTRVTGTPYVFMPDVNRSVRFLAAQDEWSFAPDWELTAGLRYDRYSDFGSTTNPRLALVWSTSYNLTSKLLYGRAFRAPSLSELYFQNNPVALGNRDLAPETIDTVELAFDYRPSPELQFDLDLFRYRARDLIEFVPNPNSGSSSSQNTRDQDGKGGEIEVNWRPSTNWRLRANYAYQHATDADTDAAVANVPRQQLYLNLRWQFLDNWQLGAQVNRVMDRKRAPGDPRPAIDDYTWTDLSLRREHLGQHWTLGLSLHNVFDVDAREPAGTSIPGDYPLEGRSTWLEISYRQ